MQNALDKVDELSKLLKALLPMKPEYQQKLDNKFRLEFNYNSNHMEGNTLTYGETELLLMFGDTKGIHTLREYEEMKGHDVAIKLIEDWATDKEHPLTESYIKNLNQVILKEPFWKEAITPNGQNTRRLITVGIYKEHHNSVRLQNGEIFNYASPVDTPILMQELIEWYRTEERALHPVTLAAMLHYKFVSIHPFDDGNGRIARLLMNYVFLKNNLPPIIIKSADKQNYLRALHLADIGDYEPFLNYIAEQVVWSLEVSIKAAKGESIEESDDIDKEIELLNKRLSDKKIQNSSKAPALIYQLLKNSLIPLFILLEEKCEKLKPLFIDFSKNIQYQVEKGRNITLGSKESKWEILKINWLENKIKGENISLDSLQYTYSLEGFKSSLTHQYFSISLNFTFDQFTYSVKISNGTTLTFPYNKQLSEKEKNDIISLVMNDLLDRIKKAADNEK